jgi:5-methyltetrahydropteroyltriglutamate--homocysteine methyltransferase
VKSVRFDKKLGAGIVDGRNTRLESLEQIEESLRRLSESVSPDRIYVNPSSGLEYLPRETAFAKLKRMVDGARKAQPVAA